ncbi:MAG: CRAL-TRIO domain-containing protein [Monoraphidium minutum]|nr:MAG: CRAL-TRIO domain-containing protein [Monoraphidium minutum]
MGMFTSFASFAPSAGSKAPPAQASPSDKGSNIKANGGHAAPDQQSQELIAATRAALPDAPLVDAQLRRGGEEPLTDAQVGRWLAARGWDPARAAADLAAHAAWRAGFVPAGRVPASEIARELAQRKVLVQGLDRAGRAVIVLVGGNHVPQPDQDEVQRFFCYCADAAIALADASGRGGGARIVLLMDVGAFGWKNFDVAGAKTLFRMIHAHYVERLSVLYFHNASTIVMQLYRLIAPFIDPATRDKVIFLPHDPKEAAAILERDMDLAILPLSLGGSAEPRPVEGAWARVDALRAAAQQGAQPQPQAAEEGAARAALEAPGLARAGSEGDVVVDICQAGPGKLPAARAAPGALVPVHAAA